MKDLQSLMINQLGTRSEKSKIQKSKNVSLFMLIFKIL